MGKEELRLERHVQLSSHGRRYVERLLRNLDLGVKENRIKVCKECLRNAVSKNRKDKVDPPENWSAEFWLCYRLRRDGKCPLGLPPISPAT